MRKRCIVQKSNDAQLSYKKKVKINNSDAQTTFGGFFNGDETAQRGQNVRDYK